MRFGFGQSNNTFQGISSFFKYNFCLATVKNQLASVNLIVHISLLKSLNLLLIPGAKLDDTGTLGQGVLGDSLNQSEIWLTKYK